MAGNNIVELTEQNFDETVKSGTVLVDFWAPWCGPCRMQGQIIEELAGEVDGATIAKLNVDEAQAIAARYNVRSIPTLLVFKDGEVDQQFVGVQNAGTLKKALS